MKRTPRPKAQPKRLLVDIGNSRIKWATQFKGKLSKQQAATHARWQDFERGLQRLKSCDSVWVSSVSSLKVKRRLQATLRRANLPAATWVSAVGHCAGLKSGYRKPAQLGVDRWLAALGAWKSSGGHSDLVIVDVGTALTIDVVNAKGQHLGGLIAPGPALMAQSLLRETSRLAARDRASKLRGTHPDFKRSGAGVALARHTRAAIQLGCSQAAATLVDAAMQSRKAKLLLTGGGAKSLELLLKNRSTYIPDLVLRGIIVTADSQDTNAT